ncbi:MAG: sulfate adenylyltransferase subunit CysN [Steroidobacteraceae bacterium]
MLPALRFLTCGSVDDGKSTLIGRLLHDTGSVPEDQLEQLAADSRRVGTRGEQADYALLVDGLAAEREQGITIDVAYRYFQTPRRRFVVADTPGHEQYTRNMVTGASNSDVAVILIDARKGLLTQTRRHSYLVSLLGIRDVIVAVNKMDLVGFDPAVFAAIGADFGVLAQRLGLARVTLIPVVAVDGDNVATRSDRMPWYDGPALLEALESVQVEPAAAAGPFRLPVQYVNRPDASFRGYAGRIASGHIAVGDPVLVLPGGQRSRVARIVHASGDLARAECGASTQLVLADHVDVARGDVLVAADAPPDIADQFEATLVWMHADPLLRGRSYLIKLGTQLASATISPIRYRVDVHSFEHLAADRLELNEIGVVELELDRPVVFEAYDANPTLGGFLVIDRLTNATVGAGLIRFALRRAHNLHWQSLEIDRAQRAVAKRQRACVIWLTGLSGAGKSTIANLLEKRLFTLGKHTYLLDGDNVRHGLNKDLGFTAEDRVENIRRVAEVSRLMADAGLIVIVSFISPYRAERRMARELMAPGEFVEVFVDTPLAVAESRDVMGLYAKARRGELRNFTGIDAPYEEPESPELRIDGAAEGAEAAADRILQYLEAGAYLR